MPWPQDAYVGQKVVLIFNEPLREDHFVSSNPDLVGGIFTIARVYLAPFDGEVMLELKEDPSPADEDFLAGYPACYFRPLQERPRETSIEVFKQLLTPAKELV